MYEIEFTRLAEKQFYKLDAPLQQRIISSLERIRIRPYSYVKKLTSSPHFRYRVGDYRVILKIVNKKLIILVLEIGHRRKVYKK